MITAIATGEKGERVIVLGISQGNVFRLKAGMPIGVGADTHPGFPDDLKVMIFYKDTVEELVEVMDQFITEKTKINVVDKGPERPQ